MLTDTEAFELIRHSVKTAIRDGTLQDDEPFEGPAGDKFDVVDMVFFYAAVHVPSILDRADELRRWLMGDPARAKLMEQGPSYIHMGEWMEQDTALRLFALGQVLGWWQVVTAKTLGATDEETRSLAGSGFLYAIPSNKRPS
jgi:hypothetical protein